MRVLYDDNGTPRVIEGNDKGLTGTLSLGPPFAGGEQSVASVMNPEGGGVSAWPSAEAQGHPAVAVREDFPGGAVQTALVSGGAGGEVAELAVGRSGLGDGLIAFRQGQLGDAAIVAAQATAPPSRFVLTLPKGWVKPAQALVSWQPAPSADGPLSYHLVLDGHVQPAPRAKRLSGAPRPPWPELGQASPAGARHRPRRRVHADRALDAADRRRAADGQGQARRRWRGGARAGARLLRGRRRARGERQLRRRRLAHGHTSFSHRYRHAGVYRVVVHVRDAIGNAGVVSQWVSVR